jgi:hypothetical protein
MFDFYTIPLTAGQVRPIAVTGRAFLCSDLTGEVFIGFGNSTPATPILKGILLNFPEPFQRFTLKAGGSNATVSFYTSTGFLGLGPIGGSGGGGGPVPDPIHVINPSGGSLHVTQDNNPDSVEVSNFPATQPVSGEVSVSNLPATQPVSGEVSVSNFPATQPVSGEVSVSNLPATQPVSGEVSVSNFPATQPVSGEVDVGNFPSTMEVKNPTADTLKVQLTGAKRGLVLVLCAAYTPASTGADGFECPIPYDPADGTSALTWDIVRLTLRVAVAGGGPGIVIEKSSSSGAFDPVSVGSIILLSGSYEGAVTGIFGTVDSGDKLRFNISALGTAQGWTITVELRET